MSISPLPASRRKIREGLQVVENWNREHIRGGEITSNRVEDQEIAILSLQMLQMCLAYINLLMVKFARRYVKFHRVFCNSR